MKRRKDGRYQKVITINGKKHFFYSTAATARAAEKDIANQLLQYKEAEEKGNLFKDVADKWTDYHYPTLEWNTLKQYRPAVKQAIEQFGNEYIKEITSQQIEKYLRRLAAEGYAQKTVKARLLVINLIMKYAVVNGFILYNPCQYIAVPKNLPKTKREGLTEDEMTIVKDSPDKPFGIFALFILYTGCRRGEALALTYNDVDFENSQIHICKTVIWKGNKPEIKDHPKTDAGNRTIPLLNQLKPYIKPSKGLLFPNESGNLMHGGNITRLWNKYKKETGLNITPHQLRHAYATLLYDAGIDIKSAQYLMGHANIQTTMDIYTHLSQTRKRSSADLLNTYLTNI